MSSASERIRIGHRVTIYPCGKKRIWTAEYYRDGQHRRESLGTRDLKDAKSRAMKIEIGLESGRHQTPPPPISVQAACDDHLTYLATEHRSGKTLNLYRGTYRLWVAFLTRNRVHRLQQITASHFDKFRAERLTVRHANTVYLDSVFIKCLLAWAKSRKLILEDPLAEVSVKKPPFVAKFSPTIVQIEQVLSSAAEPERSQFAVLAFTGMRSGELQRLRFRDIDWTGDWIHIVSRPGGETKTRQSRKVPIHPRLRVILNALPRTPREFLFVGLPNAEHPTGRPISTRALNDRLRALLRTLRLPIGRADGFVVHSFRHFFESHTVNASVPQPIIDAWLGHRPDPSVMANVYYSLDDQVSQEKMRTVDFGSAPSAESTSLLAVSRDLENPKSRVRRHWIASAPAATAGKEDL